MEKTKIKYIGKTKEQRAYKNICPECGGKLYETIAGNKTYLYCNDCFTTIDENGEYIT